MGRLASPGLGGNLPLKRSGKIDCWNGRNIIFGSAFLAKCSASTSVPECSAYKPYLKPTNHNPKINITLPYWPNPLLAFGWKFQANFWQTYCTFVFAFISVQLEITEFIPTLLFFGYSALMVFTFWLLTGTIGFYAAYFFVCKIYGAIKIDWNSRRVSVLAELTDRVPVRFVYTVTWCGMKVLFDWICFELYRWLSP